MHSTCGRHLSAGLDGIRSWSRKLVSVWQCWRCRDYEDICESPTLMYSCYHAAVVVVVLRSTTFTLQFLSFIHCKFLDDNDGFREPRRGRQQNICHGVLLFKKYSRSVVVSNYLKSLMYVSNIKRHCPFLWGTLNCIDSSSALEGPSCWPQRALEFGTLGRIWLPERSALDLSLGAVDAYIVGIVSFACLSNSIWPFVHRNPGTPN